MQSTHSTHSTPEPFGEHKGHPQIFIRLSPCLGGQVTGGFIWNSSEKKIQDPVFTATDSITEGRHGESSSGCYAITQSARRIIDKISTDSIKQNVQTYLSMIDFILPILSRFGIDISNIPHLHGSIAEDQSVMLEWVAQDYRIAFSFEAKPERSSWHFVSHESLGEISAYGYFDADPYDESYSLIVIWLLFFVIINSKDSYESTK